MKTLETALSKTTIKSCVLTGVILLQLGFSYQVVAQNNINIANPPHSNVGNVSNVNNAPLQMVLIDNGPNVNSQFFQSINVTSIKKETPSPVKKSYVTPIYKPQTKVTAKPTNKQLAVNYKPKQIIKPKRQLLQPQKIVPAIVSASNKPVLVVQQPINIPIVNDDRNVLVNFKQEVIVNTDVIVPPVQASNRIIVNTNKVQAYASSGGSGSAKKTTQRNYTSKRKSINHFRYSTNKKITKLMARTKKIKIDPARCFVWS